MRRSHLASLVLVLSVTPAWAQEQAPCRVLCAPEFHVEPTITFTNLFGALRIADGDGIAAREPRETEFEVILSLGLPTRGRWLEFTVEAIFLPFERDSTPELEFETNFIWLPSDRTRGWVSSHFNVVDKFSSAERPTDRRAYTHKLNLELDTSVSIFNWLPEGRWLRGVELEGSLDYVATGLPKAATSLRDPGSSTRQAPGRSRWSSCCRWRRCSWSNLANLARYAPRPRLKLSPRRAENQRESGGRQ